MLRNPGGICNFRSVIHALLPKGPSGRAHDPASARKALTRSSGFPLALTALGVFLVASCVTPVSEVTSSSEPQSASGFDSSVLSQINRAITKPSELIQFSPLSSMVDAGPYRDMFEKSSYECNAVVDLQSLAAVATGPSSIRSSMHPAFGAVTDARGIGFSLSNKPDVTDPQGAEESWKQFQAGVDTATVNVWVSWLLMPNAQEAQGLIGDLAQWVEPCGNLTQERVIDVGQIGSNVTTERDNLLAFQLIEGEPGFVMERSRRYEVRWSDGETSQFGSVTSVFISQVSNVIVVATLFEDDNADRILGIDIEKVWDGTWNLVQQSGDFLIQNQHR